MNGVRDVYGSAARVCVYVCNGAFSPAGRQFLADVGAVYRWLIYLQLTRNSAGIGMMINVITINVMTINGLSVGILPCF